MSKVSRYLPLPPDWEDLGEEELERLCDRADRVNEILPELPPLKGGTGLRPSSDVDDEAGEAGSGGRVRTGGVDRETSLEQQDEVGG